MSAPRPRRWRRLGFAFLIALAASHAWRALRPVPRAVPAGMYALELGAVDGDGLEAGVVSVAYRDSRPGVDGVPAVVLLHGSPGSSRDFRTFAPRLERAYRVLRPDLPGFGASDLDVPDYSIEAHARYVSAWLDELGIERAEV